MLDKPLVLDDLEDRERGRHRDRVAAERAEHVAAGAELLSDLAPCEDGRDGMAVAHRLAEGDEVGLDAQALVRPQRGAGPAVAALNLIRDPQRSGGASEPDE